MKKQRVLVFSNHSLLISGVQSLLREHPEIELITGDDEGEIYRQVRQAAPEVVVIDAGQAQEEGGLSITRFLRENPRSTLVALSLDQPGIAALRSHRVAGTTWESLLSVLDGARRKAKKAAASRSDRQHPDP